MSLQKKYTFDGSLKTRSPPCSSINYVLTQTFLF